LENGNATYATVDSELTLLWQSLEEGEVNGTMDSFSDNAVFNPYHNATGSILAFNRARIERSKSFKKLGNAAWRMQESPVGPDSQAGNVYLTSRLDGHSVDDVLGLIDRGKYPSYNQFQDLLLLDENVKGDLDNDPLFDSDNIGHLGDDYDNTAALFGPMYNKVLFNEDSKFLIGMQPFAGNATTQVVSDDVALLSSFGGNHGGDATGYVQSFAGQLSNGAIMNTLESYNAKELGGLGGFSDQGQLADFIAAGGTFGIGQSWEPFAFSVPDDEVLLENFLIRNLTWVESAWSSIPWLSWQQVVIGDPLSKATLILDPQTIVWNGANSASGSPGDGMHWSDSKNWTRSDVADSAFQHGDTVIFPSAVSGTVNVDGPRIMQSLAFANNYLVRGDDLAIRSGEITVSAEATAVIESDIYSSKPISKLGEGVLMVSGKTPAAVVQAGTFGGVGTVAGLRVNASGRVMPGAEDAAGALTVEGDYEQAPGSRLVIHLDANTSSGLLTAGGNATLAGAIDIIPVNQHQAPAVRGGSESFTVLHAESISGQFDSIFYDGMLLDTVSSSDGRLVGHDADGLFQILDHDVHDVSLTSYFALPGDANGDLVVNGDDFEIWNAHKFTVGTTWTSADFNDDGLTDVADFNIWSNNLGRIALPLAAVPEPATSLLALGCGLFLYLSRRRA
jgi:hypothetical protein